MGIESDGELVKFGSSREGEGFNWKWDTYYRTGCSFHFFVYLFVGQLVILYKIFELPRTNKGWKIGNFHAVDKMYMRLTKPSEAEVHCVMQSLVVIRSTSK